ncbi:DUF4845 domain-containing protein [Massilia glaciei]|uniref:DUF4845 domain-containing protein n=1 Tax=Massilia glaciei TaxID=1524097 RepID=A0A2U2HFL2_9BURK|nr:DUF4845 domain-containing protein [Massilia glaciei]PWF43129.1 DUF4845 domain-containing protein [Massilia glaciei]
MVGSNRQLKQQGGASFIGVMFILAMLAAVGVIGMKVFPTFSEYRAIIDGIKVAKATGDTPAAMRTSFGKTALINDITTISQKDLIISKATGENEISVAYAKTIPLFGNVSLVIDYFGSTDPRAQATGAPPKTSELE